MAVTLMKACHFGVKGILVRGYLENHDRWGLGCWRKNPDDYVIKYVVDGAYLRILEDNTERKSFSKSDLEWTGYIW